MTIALDDIPVLRFTEIDSTSIHARRLFDSGQLRSRPAVIVAERQSAAIGRFKRAWHSPAGGLWVTIAWPILESERNGAIDGLGLRVGVATVEVVREALALAKKPVDVRLKWPNDVQVNRKKVCGSLCEAISRRSALGDEHVLLVGVGINANFPPTFLRDDLRTTATTLVEHVGEPLDLEQLRERLISALIPALTARNLAPETLRKAREMLVGMNEPATITQPGGAKVIGDLVGLDAHGMAIIRTDRGLITALPGSALTLD